MVKLRPDYAGGYTNAALTDIAWEKFDSARALLKQALQLSPDDARALYYTAQVDRHSGHSDAAVADLLEVVRQFPQSRDARRELGITYYERDDSQRAMEQFEALQAIDPDDVAAHYNLALLYRRLGMKDKAREQNALFLTRKTDPSAPTYSLDYLRAHPELNTESVPWHVHTETMSESRTTSGGATLTSRLQVASALRMAGIFLLAVASMRCQCQRAAGCPWINRATASGVLGGEAVESVDASKPDAVACTFQHRDKSSTDELDINVTTVTDTWQLAALKDQCTRPSTELKAIGNEAVLCVPETPQDGISQRVIGRVRNRIFVVTLSKRGDRSGRLAKDILETRIRMIAEQVAGSLF